MVFWFLILVLTAILVLIISNKFGVKVYNAVEKLIKSFETPDEQEEREDSDKNEKS